MATSSTSAASSFNGSSTFSADLQNVITRAVGIANMPITQLQNQRTTLTGEQSELQTMGGDFKTLQNALGAIDSAVSSGSLSASVGSPTIASASLGTGAMAGSYSVNITNLGSQTNTIGASTNSTTNSTATVADPTTNSISSSSTFTLTVGTTSYALTPAGNNLNSLAAAINASGANVQASVVNLGTLSAPQYELSIQGTAANAKTVTLSDGTSNLLGATNTAHSTGVLAVTDPASGNISKSSTFSLTVGSTSYSITPASSTLDALVQAINKSGANVQATVVNVGGAASPNYELSIQGTQLAAAPIQLSDGTNNLLTTMTAGSPVSYAVNGQASVTSPSRTLSISTGLTVTALTTGTTSITVVQDGSGVENALASLVTSFNAATDELTNNHGQNGGALAGQAVVLQLGNVLHSLTNYSGSGSSGIQSIADLGLSFDTNGHLQFDSSVFQTAASSSLPSVMSFLGSETDNTGFLGAANTALNTITDLTTGAIVTQISSLASSVSTITAKIAADQTRISQMQTNLTAKMAAADAAIASLQNQATQMTNLFAAEAQASKNITG